VTNPGRFHALWVSWIHRAQGPRLSAMMVQSMLPISYPSCLMRRHASVMKTSDVQPFHLGSLSGNNCPMSGMPSAPVIRGLHSFTLSLELAYNAVSSVRYYNAVSSVVAGDGTAQLRLMKWTVVSSCR
jgi:hypothetical protein